MVEWFLPKRDHLPEAHAFDAGLRTEVSGFGGSVVIETCLVVETSFSRDQLWRWETTVCPADEPDADGLEALTFARCDSHAEAFVAHQQAVEFTLDALASTVRDQRARS